MDIWFGFPFLGEPKSGVIPEPHLDWEAREGLGEERPCPMNTCRLDKMLGEEQGLGKEITFPGKLIRKSRSFQVGLLSEGLVKEIKIKHNCNRKQNLVSAVRAPWDGNLKGVWRRSTSSWAIREEGVGVWEDGEKEGRKEEGGRLCEKQSTAVLCSLLYILIFPMVLKAISLAADSEIYHLQAGTLPLSSRLVYSAAFSTS